VLKRYYSVFALFGGVTTSVANFMLICYWALCLNYCNVK